MSQWGIYAYPFAEEGSHPVLIVSNPARAGNDAFSEVNGLFCRSVRPHFQPKAFHFLLDEAGALDNAAVVRCDHIYVLQRRFLGGQRGLVSTARRMPLLRKLLDCFQCPPR